MRHRSTTVILHALKLATKRNSSFVTAEARPNPSHRNLSTDAHSSARWGQIMSFSKVLASSQTDVHRLFNFRPVRRDVSTLRLFTAPGIPWPCQSAQHCGRTTSEPAGATAPSECRSQAAEEEGGDARAEKARAASAAPAQAATPVPAVKGANPYANPEAPYKVEQSASGKLTEPLINTPRTVVVTPRKSSRKECEGPARPRPLDPPGPDHARPLSSAEGETPMAPLPFAASRPTTIFSSMHPQSGNVIPDVFSVQQVESIRARAAELLAAAQSAARSILSARNLI